MAADPEMVDVDQLGAVVERRMNLWLKSGTPVGFETMVTLAHELDKAVIGVVSGDSARVSDALVTFQCVASILKRLDVKGQVIARV